MNSNMVTTEQSSANFFHTEDGDAMFRCNIGIQWYLG